MNVDSFFATGKTHTVCQDYTRHGIAEDGTPYAILSDGCSTAPDSDIGARLLVRAAEFDLKRNFPLEARVVIARAWAYASALGMNPRCLDATLLAIWVQDGMIRTQMYGDGYVAGRRRDGSFLIWKGDFPSGAPYYLNYLMDRKRRDQYLREFDGGKHILTIFDGRHNKWFGPCADDQSSWELLQGDSGKFNPAEFDMVAVFSDGAGTFVHAPDNGAPEALPVEGIITRTFDISPPTGVFMARSGKWLVAKWCPANAMFHNDDFSVAALNIGALPEPLAKEAL